jgi:DNA polymerase-1
MAHMSKDPKLMEIFNTAGDIYQGIADDLGVSRPAAKIIQLAISYGMGAKKLAASLGIPHPKAQGIIEAYYDTYNYFAGWKQNIEQKAQERGYVKNMYGRIRRIPLLNSKEGGTFFAGLRQAVNTVVQGSAADYIKLVMINMHRDYIKKNIPAHILLQVHDELVVECPDQYVEEAAEIQKFWMENVTKIRVPVLAEQKICDNWAQMKSKTFHGYDPKEVSRNAIKYDAFDPAQQAYASRPSVSVLKAAIVAPQKDLITELINIGSLNFN